jgi:putative SbcD/Mre11-related phosphoesterase
MTGLKKVVATLLSVPSLSNIMGSSGFAVAKGIRLLPGGAAFLTEERTLVVSDLHLGCEAALEYEGLSIPRVQTKRIGQYLDAVIREVRPSRVIVAGDLKHNFSRNLVQEWQDVERFVEGLNDKAAIEVVKGNHDNYLGLILREFGIPFGKETSVSGMRILHGHSGQLDGRPTIMGHIHPSLRLKDSVGASLKDHCFLFDRSRQILVLPALSLVSYGTDVVGQQSSDRISPLLSQDGLGEFVPIAFSGDRPLSFPKVGELRALRGPKGRKTS